MNYNWIDKTNMRWGKLAAIKYLEKGKWLCQCDCGKIKFILRKRRILKKIVYLCRTKRQVRWMVHASNPKK